MKGYQKSILVSFLGCLLLSGCVGAGEESSAPVDSAAPSENGSAVTVTAYFQREDETPLSDETVRISDGENNMDYPLGEDGVLQVSGIPSNGTFTLTLLRGTQEISSIVVRFSTAAVIDATTDSDGVGHVALKEDAEEVALIFTLEENGALSCALRFSQPSDAADGDEANKIASAGLSPQTVRNSIAHPVSKED